MTLIEGIIGTLWICLRYRVSPWVLRRALGNWHWRMAAIGASRDEDAEMFVLVLQAHGRAFLRDLADRRVPEHWWDQ
jgi:hypothetical protein